MFCSRLLAQDVSKTTEQMLMSFGGKFRHGPRKNLLAFDVNSSTVWPLIKHFTCWLITPEPRRHRGKYPVLFLHCFRAESIIEYID